MPRLAFFSRTDLKGAMAANKIPAAGFANLDPSLVKREALQIVRFAMKYDEQKNAAAALVESDDEDGVLEAMLENDIDINDIENEDGIITVYAEPSELFNIKKVLESKYGEIKYEIDEVGKFAKETVTLTGDDLAKFEKIKNAIEEVDDVQNIYHNVVM